MDIRLKEAQTAMFKKAIVPKLPLESGGIKCFQVTEVSKLLEMDVKENEW